MKSFIITLILLFPLVVNAEWKFVTSSVNSEFNCKEDTVRNIYYVFYKDKDMTDITSSYANKELSLEPVVPDSVDAQVLKVVCK